MQILLITSQEKELFTSEFPYINCCECRYEQRMIWQKQLEKLVEKRKNHYVL